MTKKAKLLERVRNSPKDAKFSEVQKLLKEAGFREVTKRRGVASTHLTDVHYPFQLKAVLGNFFLICFYDHLRGCKA